MSELPAAMSIGVSPRSLFVRARSADRLNVTLGVILFLSAIFYLWTADTSAPLSLHDGLGDRYNLLANAFIHLRLSVGPEPAVLRRFADPYDPDVIARAAAYLHPINDATSINDDAMYHGQLYFIWGPAPALILLVPLHLLGFEPSSSVTVAVYAIVGLGFALATLRVILRQIGDDIPIWMCVLAGFAVALCSVVPYIARTPAVTTDTLAGGYCFAMAGLWLAISAIAYRRASGIRLVLMSLCFGLATNSRPTLALTAVLLVPVYLALRASRSRKSLLATLVLPIGICLVLLLAYNQARFNNPLEIGTRDQLSINESTTAPYGRLSYVLPGVGFYLLTPPRFEVLFPFIHLLAPQPSPVAGVAEPEMTGGLLPFAPIVAFVVALPWIWWRRRALLGRLAAALVVVAGIGLAIPILPSYQFFASTERYETDFASLLVLGGLAAWLALSKGLTGHRRRLMRVGGGLLVAWGCFAGFATSFYGSDAELAITHPGTWRTLEDIGSPVSTVLAAAVGHPVLGAIQASNEGIERIGPHAALSTSISDFRLSPSEHANLTIVSPGAGNAALVANFELMPNARYGIQVIGPGTARTSYVLPATRGFVELPLKLSRGLNRFTLRPVPTGPQAHPITKEVLAAASLSVTALQ